MPFSLHLVPCAVVCVISSLVSLLFQAVTPPRISDMCLPPPKKSAADYVKEFQVSIGRIKLALIRRLHTALTR